MEYCQHGNLYDYVNSLFSNKSKPFTYQMKLKIFRDIRNSQEYLYQNQFIHRDIKLENFLVTTNGNELVVKCCDFGQTRSKDKIMSTKTGTPMYVDNNRFEGKIYSEKTDLYSIGVCFYYIATGQFPPRTSSDNMYYNFYTKTSSTKMIFEYPLQENEYHLMKNLIEQLLQHENSFSITWEQFFNHQLWK